MRETHPRRRGGASEVTGEPAAPAPIEPAEARADRPRQTDGQADAAPTETESN